MKTNDKKLGYRKYLSLIILVVMFLLLTIAMLGLNYFSTIRFAKLAQSIEMSGQQGAITQQLSKNLYDINLYIQAALKQSGVAESDVSRMVYLEDLPQIALYKIEEIQQQRNAFAQGLAAFTKGGKAIASNGQEIELSAVTHPMGVKSLQETQAIWTPYLGLLDHFIEDTKKGVVSEQTSNYLVDYSRLYNQALLTESNRLSAALNAEVSRETLISERWQLGGVVLAFALFLWIVFGALRQLLQGDERLAIARQQTSDILDTVNEGLFLIDKDLLISDEYSRSLELIFGKKDLHGKTLLEILQGAISDEDLNNAKLFVEQLYNTWVVEELIQDLNPLKQIKINIVTDKAESHTKYLNFNFLRIVDEQTEEINKVFVSVVDVTDAVLLEKNLEKVKEQHDRELEMLGKILSVDNNHLLSFIANTQQRIERMNELLKQKTPGREGLRDKASQLFRVMHSLKGDASALGLSAFVGAAEKQESLLKDLLKRTHLSGNDFLSFTVNLEEMIELNKFVNNLVERLRLVGQNMNHVLPASAASVAVPQNAQPWKQYFEEYAQSIAERHEKQVRLYCGGFDAFAGQDKRFDMYKDIAVQLLKNAIVHGIETPSERLRKGKAVVGEVKLLLRRNSTGELCLGIEDDGQGIRLNKLRRKAVELGLASPAEAEQLSEQALYRVMLQPGVSTAEVESEDAGRGVGMDIVNDLVQSANGKLSVVSKENEFTRIVAVFAA